MKITIKLTLNQFEVLHSMFDGFDSSQTKYLGRETRVKRYILEKPITRIQKQMIDLRKEINLFSGKKIKVSLEYYEAHYLEKFLEVFDTMNQKQDINRWNVIKAIRAELNAKLA
ncbi:MAG: hypothetical protein AB7D46_00715 [Flavobacteriaceae bacterium]